MCVCVSSCQECVSLPGGGCLSQCVSQCVSVGLTLLIQVSLPECVCIARSQECVSVPG